ncbi:hypothetical protein FF38_00051 [Lucilia cuprina]|uniref:Uncharacterized protein n=1 Tax=Lucilia cuprina TaxID=7375 RepID=A0A0L0BML2_LUCCU|nr:hypothetical protein FF38_00051 [Lucilia cuprina]
MTLLYEPTYSLVRKFSKRNHSSRGAKYSRKAEPSKRPSPKVSCKTSCQGCEAPLDIICLEIYKKKKRKLLQLKSIVLLKSILNKLTLINYPLQDDDRHHIYAKVYVDHWDHIGQQHDTYHDRFEILQHHFKNLINITHLREDTLEQGKGVYFLA